MPKYVYYDNIYLGTQCVSKKKINYMKYAIKNI